MSVFYTVEHVRFYVYMEFEMTLASDIIVTQSCHLIIEVDIMTKV